MGQLSIHFPSNRGIATTSLRTGLAMTGNFEAERQTPICFSSTALFPKYILPIAKNQPRFIRKAKKKWPLTAESSDSRQPRVISVRSYYLTSVINPAFCRFDAVQPARSSCPAAFHLQSHKRDTLMRGGSPTVDTRPWGRVTCTSVSLLWL